MNGDFDLKILIGALQYFEKINEVQLDIKSLSIAGPYGSLFALKIIGAMEEIIVYPEMDYGVKTITSRAQKISEWTPL